MPSFTAHFAQSRQLRGAPYEQVHLWLNEFAGKEPYGMRHRCKRHHAAGIEEVRRMFGDQAVIAAKLHIEMDLMEEGWTKNDPFPRDEQHFVNMGLY